MPLPPPFVLGIIVIISWASSFPVIQMALQGGVSPIPLGALRCALAFLSLLPVLFFSKGKFPKPNLKDWLRIFITGGLGFGVYSYLLNAGEVTVSSGVTSLIMASTPIFAAIIANVVTTERLTAFGWFGSFIAFVGVGMLSLLGHDHSAAGPGILILIVAAIVNGLYAVFQRPVVNRFGGLRAVLYLIGAGALVLTPWLPQGIAQTYHAGPIVALEVLWLALVPSVIGYACWGFLIGSIGPTKGGMFMYGVAPTALVMSYYLLGQDIYLSTCLGGLVIIIGVIFSRLQRKHFRSLQKPF